MNRAAPLKKTALTFADRIAYVVATGAGAGLLPVAPGTFGALEAVLIFALTSAGLRHAPQTHLLVLAALNLIILLAGVWAARRTCELCGIEDPSQIVIDEVSGQLIALTPLAFAPSVIGTLIAFALFRAFDIVKPYPIRKLEHWRSGYGVMADDVLAGIYAGVVITVAITFHLL